MPPGGLHPGGPPYLQIRTRWTPSSLIRRRRVRRLRIVFSSTWQGRRSPPFSPRSNDKRPNRAVPKIRVANVRDRLFLRHNSTRISPMPSDIRATLLWAVRVDVWKQLHTQTRSRVRNSRSRRGRWRSPNAVDPYLPQLRIEFSGFSLSRCKRRRPTNAAREGAPRASSSRRPRIG